MKNIIILSSLFLFVGCHEVKHDPEKQVHLLQECVSSHVPGGYSIESLQLSHDAVSYCERFAEENSRIDGCK